MISYSTMNCKVKYIFLAVVAQFYILQNITSVKFALYVWKFLPHAFQDPTLNGTTVAASSEVRTTAILLLLFIGILRVRRRGNIEWHNIHTKFHENRSVT
jgi:hypothetical protein